jgi:hypothetical protein
MREGNNLLSNYNFSSFATLTTDVETCGEVVAVNANAIEVEVLSGSIFVSHFDVSAAGESA